MNTITTKDGTQIYYKDWGSGQSVVFSHEWPLSSDSWEALVSQLKCDKRVSSGPRWGSGSPAAVWGGCLTVRQCERIAAG